MKVSTRVAALVAGAVLATAAVATTASAADLARRGVAKSAELVPLYNWSGIYIGANAGYGFNAEDGDDYGYSYGDDGGFVGGGQIGVNWQFNQLVVGVETDIQYADLTTKYVTGYEDGVEWFGTVRARAGFAIERFLVYATGGFAYGGGDSAYFNGVKNDDTKTGWTVGGGFEYAFSPNITGRIEGLYVSLDRDDHGSRPAYVEKELEFGVIRAGLNFKFSTF
ncbi:outer membrane protein [Blastochloris viridis]|uniref:Opacity protein antigens n=1 Tax=Blastochloris viridis TaxID=1079 RepID=A0A0H5BBB3_BLAVI|nr:outer membrane beta-barrel protein [Blastochloris viridis]ALK10580.1 hypothetical protein BVIR_2815 [Blastochloris viridis]BAR99465.1 putative outer-membrane immunogenic protein precursor [Blastochloris viridis]CUU43242.1 Opacity protein antigens [Blastochloris viridis]